MTAMAAAQTTAATRRIGPAWLLMLLVIAAAFVLRSRYFGSPNVHVDEQFYLLMGDRMLHGGAIPYVDIWDRKPVGLFLLYAAIRLLGGDGIIQYQIVATLFAGATAAIIAVWGARLAGQVAGAIGGLFYLILIHKFSGYGGEAEVFLNLLTTSAALIVAGQLTQDGTSPAKRQLLVGGLLAMALSGLAMQIKQTAVFPGIFLGLALIHIAYCSGWPKRQIIAASILWAGVALLPTALVVGWYAAQGHLAEFMFATVYSVGLRHSDDMATLLDRFRSQALSIGLPVAGTLAIAWPTVRRDGSSKARQFIFLLGWLASSIIAFLSVGTFYKNYAMIVAPMTCILLGMVAKPKGAGWLAIGGMAVMSIYILVDDQKRVRDQQAMAPAIYGFADAISANLHGGCLYVHRGLPIFYYLTHACLPSRFAFPGHLNLRSEGFGLGVDPADEVRRILASRPSVIVLNDVGKADRDDNRATAALVDNALARNYRIIATAGPPGPGRFKAYGLIAPGGGRAR